MRFSSSDLEVYLSHHKALLGHVLDLWIKPKDERCLQDILFDAMGMLHVVLAEDEKVPAYPEYDRNKGLEDRYYETPKGVTPAASESWRWWRTGPNSWTDGTREQDVKGRDLGPHVPPHPITEEEKAWGRNVRLNG